MQITTSETPVSDAALQRFDSFVAAVKPRAVDHGLPIDGMMAASDFAEFAKLLRARVEGGRDAYGDSSFGLSESALRAQAAEEAADLAGWSFVRWIRYGGMEPLLIAAEGFRLWRRLR